MMRIIFEILFLGAIVGIADLQAHMIADKQVIRHFWWGCLFGGLIIGGWWLEGMNYWFAAALVLEHFIFFSPVLNFSRSPRMPFFYISSQPKTGSIWDALLIKVEPAYPWIWAISGGAFVFVQFKL